MKLKIACLGFLLMGAAASAQTNFSGADLYAKKAGSENMDTLRTFNSLRNYPNFIARSNGAEFISELDRLQNLVKQRVSSRPQQGQLGPYGENQPVLGESHPVSVDRGLSKEDLNRISRYVEELPTDLKPTPFAMELRKILNELQDNAIVDSDQKVLRDGKIARLEKALKAMETEVKGNIKFAHSKSMYEVRDTKSGRNLTIARIDDQVYTFDQRSNNYPDYKGNDKEWIKEVEKMQETNKGKPGNGQWVKDIEMGKLEKFSVFEKTIEQLKKSGKGIKSLGSGLGASVAISTVISALTVGTANAEPVATDKVGSAELPQPLLNKAASPAAQAAGAK